MEKRWIILPTTKPTQSPTADSDSPTAICVVLVIFVAFFILLIWRHIQKQMSNNKESPSSNYGEELAMEITGTPTDREEQKITFKIVEPLVPFGIEDEQKENVLGLTKGGDFNYQEKIASVPMNNDIDDLEPEIPSLPPIETVNGGDYLNWNNMDILMWIMSIDNGLFLIYKDKLEKSLVEENVRGSSLSNVDKMDIKIWGVNDIEHRAILYQNIKSLTNVEGK